MKNATRTAALAVPFAAVSIACQSQDAPEPLTEALQPITVMATEPFAFDPLACRAAILIEAESGAILYEMNADAPRAPASVAKMTLELVVMEAVANGELSLDDPIEASAWASKMGGSQVYLKQGEVFPLRELMKSIAIASANDACVAVAEHVAGDAAAFVDFMNRRVKALGLTNTRYVNVHGLDDDPVRQNITTARDIARIAQEIIRHQKVLEWSSMDRVPFRNGTFILENTNTLIGRFAGMDGIKTGYTERAGYNLCATAERNGSRYISVVMGSDSRAECARVTSRLLSRAFHDVLVVDATERGAPITESPVDVKLSQDGAIRPVAAQDVRVIVSAMDGEQVIVYPRVHDPLNAPLLAGSPVGEVMVEVKGTEVARVAMLSDQSVEASGMRAWLHGMFGF